MIVYKVTLEAETDGMDAISFVLKPATEQNFLVFSEELKLSLNEEERLVSGVVMLADTPIPRYSPTDGEYSILFEQQVIKEMMIKYSKNNLLNSVNIEHTGEKKDGVFLIESYIYNSERNIAPKDIKATEGSWIATFKVENEEVWQQIKEGKIKGFSLEGIFSLKRTDDFDNYLKNILSNE